MNPPPADSAALTRRHVQPQVSAGADFEVAENLGPLQTVGAYVRFVWAMLSQVRHLGPFAGEVLRQAAIIAAGTLFVMLWVSFLVGNSCGLETTIISRSLGADLAAPFVASYCNLRESGPITFGYILAAKVGCGMVAEIGAMRVAQEVEATKTMGVRPIAALVTTRFVGAMLVLPVMYLIVLAVGEFGSWVSSYVRFGDVSQGTWEFAFFQSINSPVDLLYTWLKGAMNAAIVVSVCLFFGYRVQHGPVEVGIATARSMGVNLMLITVLNALTTLIFWGSSPNVPIA